MVNKKDKKEEKERGGEVKSISNILDDYTVEKEKQRRISQEFQDYAYRLALELDDEKHKSLYMKLAKEKDRGLLEEAKSFVKGASDVENKGALFMWKLKQLRKEADEKKENK